MGKKYILKCNFYIKYFDKIQCYVNRPYLVFSELKPETHIYFFWPKLSRNTPVICFTVLIQSKDCHLKIAHFKEYQASTDDILISDSDHFQTAIDTN